MFKKLVLRQVVFFGLGIVAESLFNGFTGKGLKRDLITLLKKIKGAIKQLAADSPAVPEQIFLETISIFLRKIYYSERALQAPQIVVFRDCVNG